MSQPVALVSTDSLSEITIRARIQLFVVITPAAPHITYRPLSVPTLDLNRLRRPDPDNNAPQRIARVIVKIQGVLDEIVEAGRELYLSHYECSLGRSAKRPGNCADRIVCMGRYLNIAYPC